MKKNNKYRPNSNNNNSAIYSLNYKFDSNSIAGKISGTALDLIKRYNDLAKDARSNSDHVNAEIFRQYAEHYRKIVTDINERKNVRNAENNQNKSEQTQEDNAALEGKVAQENNAENMQKMQAESASGEEQTSSQKSFEVIDISKAKDRKTSKARVKVIKSKEKTPEEESNNLSANEKNSDETESKKTAKRQYRKKSVAQA